MLEWWETSSPPRLYNRSLALQGEQTASELPRFVIRWKAIGASMGGKYIRSKNRKEEKKKRRKVPQKQTGKAWKDVCWVGGGMKIIKDREEGREKGKERQRLLNNVALMPIHSHHATGTQKLINCLLIIYSSQYSCSRINTIIKHTKKKQKHKTTPIFQAQTRESRPGPPPGWVPETQGKGGETTKRTTFGRRGQWQQRKGIGTFFVLSKTKQKYSRERQKWTEKLKEVLTWRTS